MFKNITVLRRTAARIGLGATAGLILAMAVPGAAQAHVTVQGEAEGGGFSVVAFRVPNERDDASTTQLRVILPKDQPIGSVQTTPVAGWKVTTVTRKLDKPIEMEGEKLNTVVSRVTWTATSGGVKPAQFQDFELSLGPLPESGSLVFSALQTYSDGEKVNWNEVSADPSVEPEHPAPTLEITPADAAKPAATDEGTSAGAGEQAPAETQTSTPADNASLALPIALSGAALVLSMLAAVLAWPRRRPVELVASEPESAPDREHVEV
jgi:uncharacterized protein YcnI